MHSGNSQPGVQNRASHICHNDKNRLAVISENNPCQMDVTKTRHWIVPLIIKGPNRGVAICLLGAVLLLFFLYS